jgi:hypothetical protein
MEAIEIKDKCIPTLAYHVLSWLKIRLLKVEKQGIRPFYIINVSLINN